MNPREMEKLGERGRGKCERREKKEGKNKKQIHA